MNNIVIFSTDGQDSLRGLAKGIHFIDVIAAMRHDVYDIVPVWGMYKGRPELSFACDEPTWERYIKDSPYVQNQESILILNMVNEKGYLKYLETGEQVYLGKVKGVDNVEGLDSWSYVEDAGYWVVE